MKPIIIVGAPRSGTNALRDALSSLDAFSTWPCDELNALWRTTNSDYPTDALPAALATDAAKDAIRAAFAARQAHRPDATVIEKTCANTLRLPFVAEVFPHARYLEIIRDGRDATASAIKRWQAPFDLRYSLEKLRWVPRSELSSVVSRAVANRFRAQDRPSGASVNTWGPIWPGLDELLAAGADVNVLAAHQWVACATAADTYFVDHPDAGTGHLRVRYEDLVQRPAQTLARIVAWAEATTSRRELEAAAATIHTGSIGAWRRDGDVASLLNGELKAVIEPANQVLGY